MDPILVYAAGDLDSAGIPVDRELPPAWLAEHLSDVEATAERPGHVTGRLSLSGTDHVVVRCDARAEVTVPCARCLGPAPVDLRAELSLLLRPGKVLPEPARVLKAAETRPDGGDVAKKRPAGPGTAAVEAARTLRAAKGAAGRRALGAGVLARKGAKGAAGADSEARGARGGKLPEYEFSAEEADHDLYDGETVVLDGFVREALLLEVPNFPLCSEDCPGIGAVPEVSSDETAGGAPAPGSSPGSRPSAASGEGASEPARPPGTRSLGDALRAALAAKSGAESGSAKQTAPKPKKR